ncbi:ABC transporter permease [Candidatus Sumerlaeota bacterium]|nr:ABC transporter permease [Candidatus Sumerlaeota bacterium]
MRWIPRLLRSILAVVVVSWAVATATFILMKSVPGGPLSRERKLPDAVRKAIEEKYHLNDPVLIQYRDYLMDAAAFRFGLSFDDPGRTVGEIILKRLPRSMILGALALGISLTLAFILGTAAAVWRGRWPDRLLALTASAGVSVPSFILGSLLLYWFSYRIRLFPAGGWDGFSYAILPAISLVIHGLRHTLSPVLAYLGPQAAAIMTGSFVVEKIFNVPGLGMMYVQSIGNRNYPMIMGVTLVYTVMLVVFNLLSDLAARLLDPRLRQG